MSKYTAGPWNVFENEVAPTVPYVRSNTGMIAALFGKGGEELANAVLIAAAPDLLALLDELDGEFDRQLYQERSREELDAPDDREYSVTITAKQLRAIASVVLTATTVR